jgi:hypothetical protein
MTIDLNPRLAIGRMQHWLLSGRLSRTTGHPGITRNKRKTNGVARGGSIHRFRFGYHNKPKNMDIHSSTIDAFAISLWFSFIPKHMNVRNDSADNGAVRCLLNPPHPKPNLQ